MSSPTESSALFTPLQVGRVTLSHRIVLAPLTRSRATKDHVPTELGVEYYTQRSSVPGSLLITEGTLIHPAAGPFPHAPNIYTDTQVQAWKKVRTVHTYLLKSSLTSRPVDCRRGPCQRLVHLPPTLGSRSFRSPRRP